MIFRFYILAVIVLSGIFLSSCRQEVSSTTLVEQLGSVPEGFPDVEYPIGNELTLARWELGKKLFFDAALSIDKSISCASCHKQEFAFGDDINFSNGANDAPGTRNAPSLVNVAYHPYYTREGGLSTLEMQVLVPIQEHNEFNHNIVKIAEELQQNSEYVQMSLEAYGRQPDAFVITRALSNFERTLISGGSEYDSYVQTHNELEYSAKAKKGMELFFSERLACGSCHSGFNFTNYQFENNGLYSDYLDSGRYRFTEMQSDVGRFKVPSLRNIEVTGPYMHDGSLETLEEVIDHYSTGGQSHENKSSLVKGFSLSANEKDELITFLNSLTDHEFLNNPIFFE